ncbi:CobW/HypB/UreG, nucleotide-binding domain-containing protein [Suillus subaureus]|uniref:CobW/HypB/UreG, nucleotide-binding domain-containing protein n=1 Tax=Suillus subaureus TaxID=48587 RepID=A0A9P7EIN1_9AGAM|nr:CobW/HypB/UreG, nucleotide-binding domain-containing protein [Suillus subaureus]KAG1822575.1 CobW/HypB/UreG, nucleotide-binding domain-containing protein [Suillus subaureus]
MPDFVSTRRVPCTIISGFLGAGKSTLLRRILTERHGYRIAVIMNEFGDTSSIEAKAIGISSEDDPTAEKSQEFLELANGCLCCSIKDAGVAAIEKLMQRKGAFDHILLETTGLADPGPIASMFWLNEEYAAGLGRQISLDGVVCVVDAVFGQQQMEEDHSVDGIGESLRQIACSDVILLNKVDLASEGQLRSTEELIQRVNPSAPIHRTVRGQIDLAHIMNINAYAGGTKGLRSAQHQHGDDDNHDHAVSAKHYELRGISSLQITLPTLTRHRLQELDEWIRTVLWENRIPDSDRQTGLSELKVLRCKGLFVIQSGEQYVLQGVQSMYDLSLVEGDVTGIPDSGKLVLIGKGLNDSVRQSLKRLLV